MNGTEILEIVRRRRAEANDRQIGLDATGNKEEAQIWWRIMTEYDDLLAEVQASS